MKIRLTILLLYMPLVLLAQAGKFKITKIYGDFGLHMGTSQPFFKVQNYYTNNGAYMLYPAGLYTSFVVGNDRFLAKLRYTGMSDDNGIASNGEIAGLIGITLPAHKLLALDILVGLGYNEIDVEQYHRQYTRKRTIGLAFEANANFIPLLFFCHTLHVWQS